MLATDDDQLARIQGHRKAAETWVMEIRRIVHYSAKLPTTFPVAMKQLQLRARNVCNHRTPENELERIVSALVLLGIECLATHEISEQMEKGRGGRHGNLGAK